jgi:HSF-type DNA-binding
MQLTNVFAFCLSTAALGELGRIIVHDRVQLEADVLPRYFNHSSFASLRRQLNYFQFVRVGKSRRRESTYVNNQVAQLDDILNLRRRRDSLLPTQAISDQGSEQDSLPGTLRNTKGKKPEPQSLAVRSAQVLESTASLLSSTMSFEASYSRAPSCGESALRSLNPYQPSSSAVASFASPTDHGKNLSRDSDTLKSSSTTKSKKRASGNSSGRANPSKKRKTEKAVYQAANVSSLATSRLEGVSDQYRRRSKGSNRGKQRHAIQAVVSDEETSLTTVTTASRPVVLSNIDDEMRAGCEALLCLIGGGKNR